MSKKQRKRIEKTRRHANRPSITETVVEAQLDDPNASWVSRFLGFIRA